MKNIASLSVCVFLFLLSLAPAGAADAPTLREGIEQYQKENFEEAIVILEQVRRERQTSSQAAFFLGMAYKQVMDYPRAAQHLEAAVTLAPPIREALVELIDSLYQIDRLGEAKIWLKTAEEIAIFPGRVAFLRGLILVKENKNTEAIAAFEQAKQRDPALTQPSEFQIGIALIKEQKMKLAKARFQAVVAHDPLSDLASFARQYQEMIEERLYQERPLRLTLSVFGGYDTNIVLKPLESVAALGITDEKGAFLSTTARIDYVPKLSGPWLFNAQYSLASNVNSVHTHSHDSLANGLSVTPGYNFGTFVVNLNASYANVLLRTDPDLNPDPDSSPGYKRYLDYRSIGPAFRAMINQTNILEVFIGYDQKVYFNQKITSPDSDRDAEGMREYISWFWIFRPDSFLNLRYDFANEVAGRQWTNHSHRFTVNLNLAILSDETARRIGPVTVQLTGSALFQNYRYEFDYGTITDTRRDKVYTGSLGVAWRFWKYATFIAQYTRTQSDSNVSIYEYDRNQYAAGLEFRY